MVDEVDGAHERRRESRFGARIDVRFARAADAARALNAFSLNFSAGGLCVRTKAPHELGQRLEVDLSVEGHPFQLEAEVAWVRGETMGLRFVNVRPPDRARLETVARALEARGAPIGDAEVDLS